MAKKTVEVRSKDPLFYAFVTVSRGRIMTLGNEKGRDGGTYWRRHWPGRDEEISMSDQLTEGLASQVEEFGLDYYEDILEAATEDAKWLPRPSEMDALIKSKKLKRAIDKQAELKSQRTEIRNEINKLDKEIYGLIKEGIVPAQTGTYSL
jgi:hypothetical protein